MKITIKHRTDQLNADDFIGGPGVFTVAEVKEGKAEQQYDIALVETDKFWRPPVQVLMLLVAAWGDDAKAWQGRKVELYRDESVTFGRDQVGGIRVSRMTDLPSGDKPFSTKVTATRGKRINVSADPLVLDPAEELATAKKHLWQLAQAASDQPLDHLNNTAAEHNLSLDVLADVQQLIGVMSSD